MFKFPRPTIKVGKCLAVFSKGEALTWNRYIPVKYRGEGWLSHRLSYHLHVGKIPRSPMKPGREWTGTKQVLHTCDHKWCIEPKHLYLGNHSKNSQDFWDRMDSRKRKLFCVTMAKVQASPEYREAMSKSTKGIKRSEETKKRISLAARRRPPPSLTTRKRMSISAKARIRNGH